MRSGLRWLWVSLIVIIIDRLTKYAALHYLTEYVPYKITSFFNFTLSYNKGAAFSFLHRASGWQMWFFGGLAVIVSVILLIWLTRISSRERWLGISLTLIIGGALSNLMDRIYYGHVIDFLQVHAGTWYWPTFNVADSAICVGAFMLLWDALKKK